jgi:hypothetical protein
VPDAELFTNDGGTGFGGGTQGLWVSFDRFLFHVLQLVPVRFFHHNTTKLGLRWRIYDEGLAKVGGLEWKSDLL